MELKVLENKASWLFARVVRNGFELMGTVYQPQDNNKPLLFPRICSVVSDRGAWELRPARSTYMFLCYDFGYQS